MALYGFKGLSVALAELENWQQETSVARRLDEHGQGALERARAKIGTYQSAVAEWPEWEKLAQETVDRKKAGGASDDQPLLGVDQAHHMRDDIEYHVTQSGGTVAVELGIPSSAESAPYARPHEQGDPSRGIHQRAFLAPSIYEEGLGFRDEMDAALHRWSMRAAARSRARSI